jgi:hypothetical protein
VIDRPPPDDPAPPTIGIPENGTERNHLISNLSPLIHGERPAQEVPGADAGVVTIPA